METNFQVQSHWTVDETLRKKLEASRVFFRNQLQCVGCYMQKFCRIEDITEIYQVDLEQLLRNLNNCETADQNISKKE